MRNIYGFTGPQMISPPYITINQYDGDEGRVMVTVRGIPHGPNNVVPKAEINMLRDDLLNMAACIIKELQ